MHHAWLPDDAVKDFSRFMEGQMLRVNVLLMGNAILMGVMVGIGAYGHRYRHHPLTRFLFLGATIFFLPIVSYIVSVTSSQSVIFVSSHEGTTVTGTCSRDIHIALVLVWFAFVQIVGINTTAIVAADFREGRSIAPPVVLTVQAIWTTYLGVNIMAGPTLNIGDVFSLSVLVVFSPFALIFAKIFLKYYAWYNARKSFAFGRNPLLVIAYMEQLSDRSHGAEIASEHMPPPLTVSREDTVSVEKHPHGYQMCNRGDRTRINNEGGLVTIDKVWELDDMLLKSTTQLKDLCFSFALFKMLRCRFAKYTSTEAGLMKAQNFLWYVMLEDSDDTRILGVIAAELSFLHDYYYYSSLPISYSKNWLPVSSIFISLLSIGYCLFGTILSVMCLSQLGDRGQIRCGLECRDDFVHFAAFGDILSINHG